MVFWIASILSLLIGLTVIILYLKYFWKINKWQEIIVWFFVIWITRGIVVMILGISALVSMGVI